MGEEAGVATYDALHDAVERDDGAKARAVYGGLFEAMLRLIDARAKSRGVRAVLEVGCGTGIFAERLLDRTGVTYRGFDVSPTGVSHARARLLRTGVRETELFVGDALNVGSYRGEYDCIVCSEVLEHIEADRDCVALWPQGAWCVCSVPNFDYPTHVRRFRTEQEVSDRYGSLIDIETVIRVPASARAGRSTSEYVRRLIRAGTQPRRLLGSFGVNAFDWYAGWFVFAGPRR